MLSLYEPTKNVSSDMRPCVRARARPFESLSICSICSSAHSPGVRGGSICPLNSLQPPTPTTPPPHPSPPPSLPELSPSSWRLRSIGTSGEKPFRAARRRVNEARTCYRRSDLHREGEQRGRHGGVLRSVGARAVPAFDVLLGPGELHRPPRPQSLSSSSSSPVDLRWDGVR